MRTLTNRLVAARYWLDRGAFDKAHELLLGALELAITINNKQVAATIAATIDHVEQRRYSR